jgi:hypothetical protein
MQRKVLKTRRKSNYAMHFIIVAKHVGGDQQSEYCTVVFPLQPAQIAIVAIADRVQNVFLF